MNFSGLRIARVVRYYPESHTADIITVDDGWRAPRVPIMGPGITGNTGCFDVPDPTPLPTEFNSLGASLERMLVAVVGYVGGTPVILGFLTPNDREVLFADHNRYLHRLPSDVYVTGDSAGNIEVFHPSGTYIRIGETPDHEDLTGKDFNKLWKIRKNTGTRVSVRLAVANGGAVKAMATIDPDGNIAVSGDGTLDATMQGDASVTAPNVTVTSAGQIKLDTPTVIATRDLQVGGNVNVSGNVTASGEVTGSGIPLSTHTHSDPQGGNVGAPEA